MQYKTIKRVIALLLTVCMVLPMLPAAVFAEEADAAQVRTAETDVDAGLEDASEQLGEYTEPADDAPAETEDSAEAIQESPADVEVERSAELDAATRAVSHRAGTASNEGRAYAGQVTLTVDSTDYILIGSKQQLEALDYYPTAVVGNQNGSATTENKRYDVTGPIWYVHQTRASSSDPWTTQATLVYPGDADLVNCDAGDFTGYDLYGKEGKLPSQAGTHAGKKLGDSSPSTTVGFNNASTDRWIYCGGTCTQYEMGITSYNYGKYSPMNNYIVFRDIDLRYDLDTPANNSGRDPWTPLMFYGLMYGVVGSALDAAAEGSTSCPLQIAVQRIRASESSTDYADLEQPTISNVLVDTPSGEIDPEKYMGVGFFASVTSSRPSVSSGSLRHIQAEVRNLRLEGLRVTNNYNSVHIDQTVLNLLTGTLGTLVGGLLDVLLTAITGKTGASASDFQSSLNDLLNARAKDPAMLATGGFVGRVNGKVVLEKCEIDDVQVNGAGSYIGGFVGFSEGVEDYDTLSDALGGLLDLLSAVLNLVPGLGLGDLITIVNHVLPVGTLIPVDYLNPTVMDCQVVNLQGDIGPSSLSWTFVDSSLSASLGTKTLPAEYNGGFIGCKIATAMIGCGVRDSVYTVYAQNYGGGFAGLARDAVIQELLTDLGVNLGAMQSLMDRLMDSKMNLQSMQVRCFVNDSDVTVSGGDYLGGFNGAMCNAYCINNEMDAVGKTLHVSGTGNCVGGFAGIATLGWAMSLGQGDQGQGTTSLLSTLKNVLGALLSSYGQNLLSLLGVGQSQILGLQFNYSQMQENETWLGSEATVEGYDYVGGLVGKSDALIMTGTNGVNLSKMTFVEHGDLTIWQIYPDMPRDKSYTVTFREMDGTTSTQTITAAENYSVAMPDRTTITSTDANGLVMEYKFIGWTITPCDHTERAPFDILYAGDVAILTGDMTLNALYSRQDYGYRQLTAVPTNWEEAYDNTYLITYGKDENMVVLTGLQDNANYESANSGGANTLEQIRTAGSDTTLFTFENGSVTRVPNLYLFTTNKVAGQEDYYWGNLGRETFLRRYQSVNVYSLRANSNRLVTGTQWHPTFQNNGTALFKNDYDPVPHRDNTYLVFDSANGYFRMGTQAEAAACDLYVWGKIALPLKYTTVQAGATLPVQDNDEIPQESSVGKYAIIRINGLQLVDGHKYVGGLVGLTGTANVGGLLNDTLSVGDFRKFQIHDIVAIGGTAYPDGSGNDGLTVQSTVASKTNDTGAGYYVGGGFGMAMGGDLLRIDLSRLNKVEGQNCVGGFAGCVGPGELLGTGGLNLQLLGMSLLTANNLLNVGQGIETTVHHDTVTGIPAGYTVEAKGVNGQGENRVYCAGGFFGRSNSTSAYDCHAVQLQWVKANDTDGRAGGFIGVSEVGGLASMDDSEGTQIKGLLDAGGPGGLLNAVGYLIPEYTKVDTRYVDGGYVQAAWAGGFAADFQSGTIDNSEKADTDWFGVYNIDHVTGSLYAGGFGAKLYSGALANAGGGISILGELDVGSIGLSNLLSLVNAYIPKVIKAGVKSDSSYNHGFIVTCTGAAPLTGANSDPNSGAAGGFVGYASGAQISYCDVTQLRHTTVTPPDDLDGQDGSSYFGSASSYAVTSTRYGGGYAGFIDIGSSASLGGGLSVLSALQLSNVLDALNVVISTVEHSDVYGGPGGFAVLATWNEAASGDPENLSGRAGGFVGWSKGGHIQDSHSWNFSYIISQIAAGGYAGEIQPGSVADALGDSNILSGLVSTSSALLTLAEDFVPTIRNSVTTCIPCGGAVRADAQADTVVQRGMAGGYVGHNQGGQIWGNNYDPWKDENIADQSGDPVYNGPKSECAAIRILSVYGYEYAGGFTGLMDAGSTADTGSLSLLWGLVSADNLLGALQVAYATEENTAVYGPLSNPMVGMANDVNHPQIPSLTVDTWNAWASHIGLYGGYGANVAAETVTTPAELDAVLAKYTYGYHVTAGRGSYESGALVRSGGMAGGYVGAMRSGTITNGQAYDAKQVVAMHAAGGFAGEMKSGSSATLGSINALGLPGIDLGSLIPQAASVFVPVVKTSSVHGYQNGLSVCCYGTNHTKGCGDAGGFAGSARGAQVWGDDAGSANPDGGCNVDNLKRVQGTRNVGGFFGELASGSTAEVDTDVTKGILQDTLDALVSSEGSLLSLLNATVSTVRNANITVADPAWGYTVEGWTDSSGENPVRHVPLTAGGFVGFLEGAVIGNNKRSVIQTNANANLTDTNITIIGLRGVEAQHYAGGFFGLADEGGAASIGGNQTSLLLKLVNLGQVSALDMFRPYIYNSDVAGVSEGFTVRSSVETVSGIMASTRYGGCSGGFGGALLNGTVENANVTNLSSVSAPNYAAGFVGYTGKSGVVDVDDVSTGSALTGLLGAQAGVADVIGSTIETSSVSGIADLGFTVDAAGGSQPIAGGFVGYGDLAQIGSTSQDPNCTVQNLKYVTSEQVAGGFIGQTSLAYLVEAELNGALLSLVVGTVNLLLEALRVNDLENLNLVQIDLNSILGTNLDILKLNLLTDDDLVYVDLLGLKIGVSLASKDSTSAAEVRIGDSRIELPVTNGQVSANDMPANVRVKLFRTNHTRVTNSSVTGIATLGGYDVFGGGATQDEAATAQNGATGGFVGLNEESTFVNCKVLLCDTVRGVADETGPFSGRIIHESVYERQSVQKMEGPNNGDSGSASNTYANTTAQTVVTHDPASANSSVFVSSDKVVLMEDTPLKPNPETTTTPTAEMQNPCLNTVDLTLYKVWLDPWNLGKTRESVTFTIHQKDTVIDNTTTPAATTTTDTDFIRTLTLTEADANTFTSLVWEKKVEGLPATLVDENNVLHRYSYYVTEAASDDYVQDVAYADTSADSKLAFAIDGTLGYVAKLTNQAILEQVVVVDYGLPVQVRVLEYLEEKCNLIRNSLSLQRILSSVQDATLYVRENDPIAALVPPDGTEDPNAGLTGIYGNLKLMAEDSFYRLLEYTPKSMQMAEPETVLLRLLETGAGSYVYTRVTFVPATTIYYESDEPFISYSKTNNATDWNYTANSSAAQAEDRPALDILDADSVYGYDAAYADGYEYGLNGVYQATVSAANKRFRPSAEFTFTGTGFDLVGVNSSDGGYMRVLVYATDPTDPNAEDILVYNWSVDTYFGLARTKNNELPYIKYYCTWDGEKWHAVSDAVTTREDVSDFDETRGYRVSDGFPTKEEAEDKRPCVVYLDNYIWGPADYASAYTFYQTPVIAAGDVLPYGTYHVVITAMYSSLFDHTGRGSYNLYLDGVRIYKPADPNLDLDDAYYQRDGEGWPEFIELRRCLIGQDELDEIAAPNATLEGVVFIDGWSECASLSEYTPYGPNNEIYLTNGQAIAFQLQCKDPRQIDRIHLSMKRTNAGSGGALLLTENARLELSASGTQSLDSSTERYYDVTDAIRWERQAVTDDGEPLYYSNVVVILNSVANNEANAMLSVRCLKVTFREAPNADNQVSFISTGDGANNALTLVDNAELAVSRYNEALNFKAASVSLKSDLALNFYVPMDAITGADDAYVLFDKDADGAEPVKVRQYSTREIDGVEYAVFTFRDIPAKEMGREVMATLYTTSGSTESAGQSLRYSVKQYAMEQLALTNDAGLKTLLVDMLNYGAMAQRYFDYDTDALVNADLTPEQQALGTAADPTIQNDTYIQSIESPQAQIRAASLSLEYRVGINFFMILTDYLKQNGHTAEDLTLRLQYEDQGGEARTVNVPGSEFLHRGNDWIAGFSALDAAQMRTTVTAQIFAGLTPVSNAYTYSIASYVSQVIDEETSPESLVNLVKAMLRYGDSASSYFS